MQAASSEDFPLDHVVVLYIVDHDLLSSVFEFRPMFEKDPRHPFKPRQKLVFVFLKGIILSVLP